MIYSFWNTECDRLKLVIIDHFFALLPQPSPLKPPKSARYIIIIHKCAKNIIIWGTVPKVRSETDRIFYHFGSFFPFYSPNNPENQNFEKLKKESGDAIILHMCTKNHDHMPYCFWDMVRDGCFQFYLTFFKEKYW